MNKVAIFGKKGSISKYDLTENKPIWVGDLTPGYKPDIIGQYENYVIVFSSMWTGSKMVHCFKEDSGEFLWSHFQQTLHSSLIPFIPHTLDNHMYYLSSSKEVAKLSWDTGEIVFRKRFKKSIFTQYSLAIISDDIFLISKKGALLVNHKTGDVKPYPDLSEKLNLKEISSVLGNGVTFMSSIYLTHPQPTSDGAGAGGGGE
jgi:outer membrane protein assembly factor BamB